MSKVIDMGKFTINIILFQVFFLLSLTNSEKLLTFSSLNDSNSENGELLQFEDIKCGMWPKVSKFPIECCSVPEYFDMKVKSQCISNCTRPNKNSFDTVCCTTQCLFEESGFVSDGNLNPENIKNVVSKALENNENVLTKLDKIIQRCQQRESKPGNEKCESPQYTDFLNCLQQKLFNLCPESKPDNECKEIKEFMQKCPNAQRIFKASQFSTTSPIKDKLAEAMREVING